MATYDYTNKVFASFVGIKSTGKKAGRGPIWEWQCNICHTIIEKEISQIKSITCCDCQKTQKKTLVSDIHLRQKRTAVGKKFNNTCFCGKVVGVKYCSSCFIPATTIVMNKEE